MSKRGIRAMSELRGEMANLRRDIRQQGSVPRGIGEELGFIGTRPKKRRARRRRAGVLSLLSNAIPAAMTSVSIQRPQASQRIPKTFELDPIETGTTLKQLIPLHPGWIANSPLVNLAKSSTHYRIRRFSVTWQSAVSTGTNGTMTIGYLPMNFKVKMTDIQTYLRASGGAATGNLFTSFTAYLDTRTTAGWYKTNGVWGIESCPGFMVAKSTSDTAGLGRFAIDCEYEFLGSTPGNHAVLVPGEAEVLTVSTTSTVPGGEPGNVYILLEDYTVSTGEHLVYPGEAMICRGTGVVRLVRDGMIMDFDMDSTAGAAKDFEVIPLILSQVD